MLKEHIKAVKSSAWNPENKKWNIGSLQKKLLYPVVVAVSVVTAVVVVILNIIQ